MDFHHRARSALEREDPVRAMVLLVQGLRRDPGHDDALDLFLFIYTRHIQKPGLESDLFRALEYQNDEAGLLRFAVDELRRLEKEQMACAVETQAAERGIEIAPPIPVISKEQGTPGEESRPTDCFEDHDSFEDQKSLKSGREEPKKLASPEESGGEEAASETRGRESEELTTGERLRQARRPKKRQIFILALSLSIAVIISSVVVVGWNHAREANRVAELDEIMRAFDPLAPERAHRTLDRLSLAPGTRSDPAIAGRRQFINALLALEGRGDTELINVKENPSTPWGLAAAALDATRRGEWEEAMRFSHHLDHAYGDELPAFFVRGRICEARGEWECALARYSRVQQHFQEFVPARTGALRIAAYRYDPKLWEREQKRLNQHRPNHPYGQLPWVDPFLSTLRFHDESRLKADRGEPPPGDHFLAAWFALAQTAEESSEHRWEEAARACTERLGESPRFLPSSNVICAQASAGLLRTQDSRDFFEAAAEEEHLSMEYYRQIQIMAPRLMTDLGRADWAVGFAIPFEDRPLGQRDGGESGDFISNREARRPDHFTAPGERPNALEMEALLVRSRTLMALGSTERARRTLEAVVGDERFGDAARFERVQSFLVDGDRRAAGRGIEQIVDPSLKATAQAHLAYLEGRHVDALENSWSRGDDLRALRIRALAFLADGRAREAMAALELAEEGLQYLPLRPLKQRVQARAGEEASDEDTAFFGGEELHTLEHLIDLGGAAFWRRDLEGCATLLERALEIAPGHPEANWKVGLLRRVEGNERQSRFHFQRAWRGDEDSTYLLIELGRVHLDYGRYDRAREVFLRATLRDRRNMEALEGLGLSYYLGDRQRGRRDLAEVLGKYANTPRNAPARAELNRWLAIVYGSREGDSSALIYLERARDGIGERADLLIEEGLYYQANEDWENAQNSFARALQRNPTLPETHLRLSEVARARGEVGTAREHLERVLGLVSVGEISEEARRQLAELEADNQ